jgi:hypothetical protein
VLDFPAKVLVIGVFIMHMSSLMKFPGLRQSTPKKEISSIAYIKKKQAELKSLVQNFGKILLNWRQDSLQISILLSNLQQLLQTVQSLQRIEARNPRHQIDLTLAEVSPKIISAISAEIEMTYIQLKSYWYGHRLHDKVCMIISLLPVLPQ